MDTRPSQSVGAGRSVTVGAFATETVSAAGIVFVGGWGSSMYQYGFEG